MFLFLIYIYKVIYILTLQKEEIIIIQQFFDIVHLVLTHSPIQATSSISTHIRVDTLLLFELNRTGKL